MKDEIKEILDNIRKIIKSNRENDFNRIIYDCDSIEKLLDYITNLQGENERLLHIAKKMHTYIFLNTDNEQEAYDKLGLTEEENIMLGYSGQIIIKGGDDNE